MATTIQVSGTTKQMLELLKERKHIRTHDQVIQQLLRQHAAVPVSMFGAVKGLKWKGKDRAEFHGL